MKTIEELLKNLARPEVLEFGLVTNRLPSVNIGGKFEPVDDEAPSTERLMQMLVTMGGSRYVDSLSDKPVQWTTRLDGVGVIAVAAIMRKDVVQARFTVAKREGAGSTKSTAAQPAVRPSEKQPAAPVTGGAASSGTTQAAKPAATTQQQRPAAVGAASSGSVPVATPSPSPTTSKPSSANVPVAGAAKQTPPIQPQVIKNVGGSSSATQQAATPQTARTSSTQAVATQASATQPQPQAPPQQEEEWDDDDEPTLQTLSPPVAPPGGPKPARRAPDDAARQDAEDLNAQARAAAEKAAAERLAQEKAAQTAAQEKAEQQRIAQEKAEQQRIAQEKADQQRIAQEKAAAEARAQQEARERERLAQERATQELARIREQRAAAERAARERAAMADAARAKQQAQGGPAGIARRINTPTSVDAVDVEITTTDQGSGASSAAAQKQRPVAIDIDLDADGVESTINAQGSPGGAAVDPKKVQAAQAQAQAQQRAVAQAEKDRPRVDSSAAIDSFLAMAISARATDLHLIAGRPVLLRVATDLLPRTQSIPPEHVERIAKDIIPVRLRETFDREGACDFAVEHPNYGRFRVNASRQRTGFKLNLRVIPKETPTLASLGLPESIATLLLRHQRGLVLVTGPSSHGKSSTMAALIDHLNRETARHIVTIEEPVEHVHARKKGLVSQREVGLHTRTKAKALQQVAREDADVVVIAELRDAESMRAALQAVEAGRLVLGAMNMPSAARTIDRVVEMFPASETASIRSSLASSLRLILGQRLVPSADRTRLHAAVELLPWSVALYTLLREGRTHQISSLQQRGRSFGIVRLDESLAELARAQKVTVEVAKQFAESPADLEAQATRVAAGAAGSTSQARK